MFRRPSSLACVSQKSRKLFAPENFSGLFSGTFLGFRKVFLKAPDFRPIFSGIFSGFVARAVARAEIFQPVIGVKLTVDTAALSWFPHVCDVHIKIQNFVWWIIGKLIVSGGLLSSRNVSYSKLIHLVGLLKAKEDWCKCFKKRFLVYFRSFPI